MIAGRLPSSLRTTSIIKMRKETRRTRPGLSLSSILWLRERTLAKSKSFPKKSSKCSKSIACSLAVSSKVLART